MNNEYNASARPSNTSEECPHERITNAGPKSATKEPVLTRQLQDRKLDNTALQPRFQAAVGSWKLIKNVKFSDFLKWVGVSSWQRAIALSSPLTVCISRHNEAFKKVVDCRPFYSTDEPVLIDNKWHMIQKLNKRHSIVDGCLQTEIKGTTHNWIEKVIVQDNTLTVTYVWKVNDSARKATQKFARANLTR